MAAAASSAASTSHSQSNVVGVHYRVGKKIGEGSFGVIFEGVNLLSNQQVAIKFELRKSDTPQLRDEFRAYKILAGCVGIPNAYYCGQEGLHNVLVIDLLGPSLEDVFDWCNRRFSIKTVVMVAKQMLSRVQTIHEKNLIYRDIKPDNFLLGLPGSKNANLIYVVDFGMAKQYRDPKTKQHIPYRERKSLSGTARYMSINTHLGREQSRRDDLEALGHVFMYFLRGGLPWQGLKAATNKQKYEKIGEKKQTTPVDELCEGFPVEFKQYLEYVRNLGFEQDPDYDYMRDLLTRALARTGEVEDGVYDWMKQKPSSRSPYQGSGAGHYSNNRQSQPHLTTSRLNASQPPPPPGGGGITRHGSKSRRGPANMGGANVSSTNNLLRAGKNVDTPTTSTQAQYAATSAPHLSSPNLQGSSGQKQGGKSQQAGLDSPQNNGMPTSQGTNRSQQKPEKKSFWSRLAGFCCG